MERAEFEQLVDEALEELPGWVTRNIDNLVVVVEDRPTPEQDPHGEGLLGLYEGVSLAVCSGRAAISRNVSVWSIGPVPVSCGSTAVGAGRCWTMTRCWNMTGW